MSINTSWHRGSFLPCIIKERNKNKHLIIITQQLISMWKQIIRPLIVIFVRLYNRLDTCKTNPTALNNSSLQNIAWFMIRNWFFTAPVHTYNGHWETSIDKKHVSFIWKIFHCSLVWNERNYQIILFSTIRVMYKYSNLIGWKMIYSNNVKDKYTFNIV